MADAIRNDGMEGRRTLGLRVIRAVYQVDGFSGFYRYFRTISLMKYSISMQGFSVSDHVVHPFDNGILVNVLQLSRSLQND